MKAWTGRRARAALRQAAWGYAARGWDVVPGTYLVRAARTAGPGRPARRRLAGRVACSCRQDGCPQPAAHPIHPDWALRACRRQEAVESWWSVHPHSVLLPTGRTFEVFDVAAHVGTCALRLLERTGEPVGPVARAGGRWLFFSAPSGGSYPHLTGTYDVRHHAEGGYVAVPPSAARTGSGWARPPSAATRRLASGAAVADVLEQACTSLRATPVPAAVPVTAARPRTPLRLGLGVGVGVAEVR